MSKNVILFFRDSYDSKMMSNYLHSNDVTIDYLVIETGTKAKKKKLERILNCTKHGWIYKSLWLSFLYLYTKYYYFMMRVRIAKINNDMSVNHYPKVKCCIVEDINDLNVDMIDFKGQTILVNGTAILNKTTIDKFGRGRIFNIHSGVLPKYRNVHSDFWAFYHSDWERLGVTLISLDEGVDTGNIIETRLVTDSKIKTLTQIKVDNLMNSCDVLLDFCKATSNIQPKTQEKKDGYSFQTPSHIDFLKLIKTHGFKKAFL